MKKQTTGSAHHFILASAVFSAASIGSSLNTNAAIIWNGPAFTYVQPGTDATQPANQDRLTSDVWLTRNNTQGLFNAAEESSYMHTFSPENTEWAYGELTNYATLTYSTWETWNGKNPPSMVGQDAVVHLISDNIYLSIRFTQWVQQGGPFAYVRSTPATAPSPVAPVLKQPTVSTNRSLQFTFTNLPGYTFSVHGTTNLALVISNWPVVGTVTDAPAGSGFYNFVDTGVMTNQPRMFYSVTWP